MTNCGDKGWVSDRRGYRYASMDPMTRNPWPAMPDTWKTLAIDFANQAGFPNFNPDACLINSYHPGDRLNLHQDKDEKDFQQPIVSFSFGLQAFFMWGGLRRNDPTTRIVLESGDVLVWGGEDRLRFHAIAPIPHGQHLIFQKQRINLSFRQSS